MSIQEYKYLNTEPFNFKKQFDFDKRNNDATNILSKYPNRIPIIVEVSKNRTKQLSIDKHKYLVPIDLTLGQFIYVIRKRVKLSPSDALFIFVNNIIPPTSNTIGEIYNKYKDKDRFLYFKISSENTFG